MTPRQLASRVVALEARRGGAPSYVVRVPIGATEAEKVALIAEHCRRTGHAGPVILAPPKTDTIEEWEALFTPRKAP